MTAGLPRGWALTNIGGLGRYVNGRGFGKAEWKTKGLPIIRIQNLNDETAAFNYSDTEHEQKYRVRDGDLLVAWAASLGVYIWKRGAAWLNQHIFRVEVEERLVSKTFLYYSLKHALEALYKKTHGSGMVHVTKDRFDNHPIWLPPLNEQGRIVSKIDELFSRIEEGERALERVQKLVERYRQSVLKAAVTGELTREWREQRKGQLESGEVLLQRILKARREAWEKAELGKMKAKGIKPVDDKWKQKYQEPAAPDTSDLPELPEGWLWASVDQAGIVSGGLTKNQKRSEHELERPYLRVANVYTNKLDLSEVHRIGVSKSELDRVLLKKDDVLVVEGNGSIDQIGRVALWDGTIEGCVHQNHLIKVRCTDALPAWYVLVWCMSPLGRQQIRRVASSTAGLHTLSISKVQALPIPLPTSHELEMIRDRIEQMDSLVVKQREAIRGEARRVASLRQTVLRSAFSGVLVPQNPGDESAATLLERIRAERGTIEKAGTTRGRKKAQHVA